MQTKESLTTYSLTTVTPEIAPQLVVPFTFPMNTKSADQALQMTAMLEDSLQIERYPVVLRGTNLPRISKDPCFIVKDNTVLAIGTEGDNDIKNLGVLTAKGESLFNLTYTGRMQPDFIDDADRSDFCAAGGIYDPDSGLVISAVQTLCFKEGGRIELVSSQGNTKAIHEKTLFEAVPQTNRSVIYDSHIFRWNDDWAMTVNIGPTLRKSDIYIAKSEGTWKDTWSILPTPVLRTTDVPSHAKKHAEWNIEGSNITQLDDIAVMLAVGFVEPGEFGSTDDFGTQQRITLHASYDPYSSFKSLDIPLLDPRLERGDTYITEIGHPAFVTDERGRLFEHNDRVFFSYQGRNNIDFRWKYFVASMNRNLLYTAARDILEQPQSIAAD